MEAAAIPREALEQVKRRLFQALQTDHPLKYYLDLVHELLGLELNLCDAGYGLFAKSPDPAAGGEADWDTIDGRQYLKMDLSMSPGLKQSLARALEQSGVYVCRDPIFPYDIAFRAICINRSMAAYLFCPGRPGGFAREDLELIDFLGQVLTVEFQKSDRFAMESGLKYEYFIQELIDGRFSSDESALRRLSQLRGRPQPCYYMLSFSFDDPEGSRTVRRRYYERLCDILPDGLIGTAGGRLYMLLPRAAPVPFSARERQALLSFLEYDQMQCGVSYPFTSLLQAGHAAEQAAASVREGRSETRIHSYEQEYLFHFFAQGMSQSWLRAQILPDLLLLRRHDEVHRTELLDTLRAFIACSRSAAEAAARLHIHKSTFFYRMNKIADLLDADIYSGRWLFACEFSFYLLDYLER